MRIVIALAIVLLVLSVPVMAAQMIGGKNQTAANKTELGEKLEEKLEEVKEKIEEKTEQVKEKVKKLTKKEFCEVPAELKEELKAAWNEYYKALESADEDAIVLAKQKIESAEDAIEEFKEQCKEEMKEKLEAKCQVPKELMDELEALWAQYKESPTEELKEKIEVLEEKIEEVMKECMKPAVSVKAEMSKIIVHYKEKLGEAEKIANIDERIAALKELRDEIDAIIAELIKEKEEISAEDIGEIVSEIEVKPKKIMIGANEVSAMPKIKAKIKGKDVIVQPSNISVIIKEGELTVITPGVELVNGKVKAAVELQVTPSEAINITKVEPKEIRLELEQGKPVYKVKSEEKRKLLAIIPIVIEKTQHVDATSGAVVKVVRPWWAFLTTG